MSLMPREGLTIHAEKGNLRRAHRGTKEDRKEVLVVAAGESLLTFAWLQGESVCLGRCSHMS